MPKALRARQSAQLTDQQLKFCREYIVDFNASKAAIRADYSRKSARFQASRLLTKANIQAEIRHLADKKLADVDLDGKAIVSQFARFGFANVLDYMRVDDKGKPSIDLRGLTREGAAGIASIKIGSDGAIELKLANRERAMEALARLLKIEPPKKVIVEGEIDVTHRVRKEYTISNADLEKRVTAYLLEHDDDDGSAAK